MNEEKKTIILELLLNEVARLRDMEQTVATINAMNDQEHIEELQARLEELQTAEENFTSLKQNLVSQINVQKIQTKALMTERDRFRAIVQRLASQPQRSENTPDINNLIYSAEVAMKEYP